MSRVVTILCQEHDVELGEIEIDEAEISGHLLVRQCPKCIDEGYDEGYNDGYAAGEMHE